MKYLQHLCYDLSNTLLTTLLVLITMRFVPNFPTIPPGLANKYGLIVIVIASLIGCAIAAKIRKKPHLPIIEDSVLNLAMGGIAFTVIMLAK